MTEKKNIFLSYIEKIGNKIPHPMALFMYIIAFIIILSFISSKIGVSAIHPTTKEEISVINLFNVDGVMLILDNFIKNLQNFPVLGIIIILTVATGFCDKSGFFTTSIKMGLSGKNGNIAVFVIAGVSVLMKLAGDAAFILIPAISGTIFYGLRRNPLAGVFLGYAAVGGGFGTSIIPGSVDAILTPISVQAAKTLLPNFDMPIISGYFFLFTTSFIVMISAGLVTIKIVEPMLGKYNFGDENEETSEITLKERKAVKKALLNSFIFIMMIVLACIPENSVFRNKETHSLIFASPLMKNFPMLIAILFSILGITYAIKTNKIKNVKDVYNMMITSVNSIAGFIVLAIVVVQFLFIFDKTNLAKVLAIKGGNFLASLSIPAQLIVICFLFLTAFVNLFIGSGVTKWLLMGPIFVPMLIQLNISPAFTQVIYRLGDCSTNHLTPLFAYFAILLTTAQKYDKNVGMGTLFAVMLPYAITYLIVFSIQIVVWMTFNLPVGVGGYIWLN